VSLLPWSAPKRKRAARAFGVHKIKFSAVGASTNLGKSTKYEVWLLE
jgi:hypothetical protein